jgi:hypothetical protein
MPLSIILFEPILIKLMTFRKIKKIYGTGLKKKQHRFYITCRQDGQMKAFFM